MFRYYVFGEEGKLIFPPLKSRLAFERALKNAIGAGIKACGSRIHMVARNTYDYEEYFDLETRSFVKGV